MKTIASEYLRINIKTRSWTPLAIIAISIAMIGFAIMSSLNLKEKNSEFVVMMAIALLIVGGAFFEKQKDGSVPRKFKATVLLINSLCIGLSAGGLIFGPGLAWKVLSFALTVITLCSIISLYFVTEGVRE